MVRPPSSQAFEQMQEQHTQLLQQLNDKDDETAALMSKQIKDDQRSNLERKEQDAAKVELHKAHDGLRHAKTAVAAKDKELGQLRAAFSKCRVTLDRIQRQKAKVDFDAKNAATEAAKVSATLQDMRRRCDELGRQLQDSRLKAETAANDMRRLDEQLALTKKRLAKAKKAKKASKGASAAHTMDEFNVLKNALRCPVCQDDSKEVIIAKPNCFHLFCQGCIKKNLDTRHRKCPTCNASFGQSDVHQIYLI